MTDNGKTDNDRDALPEDIAPGPEDETVALRTEISELKDRALRAMAETENLRKRADRERQDAAQYGATKFARDMLSVADNLARALAALSTQARDDADEAVKGVISGIEATERELQAALARHGVKRIEAEGAKFDPHLHQAIAEIPNSGKAPGTVVNVVQTGYVIGERLLRPAMVTVAAGGAGASGAGNSKASEGE